MSGRLRAVRTASNGEIIARVGGGRSFHLADGALETSSHAFPHVHSSIDLGCLEGCAALLASNRASDLSAAHG